MSIESEDYYSRLVLVALLVICAGSAMLYSCSSPEPESRSAGQMAENSFLGDRSCAGCHAEQVESWVDSHHDLAMKKATDKTVLADFRGETFTLHGNEYRFFREDSLFYVTAPGPEGKQQQYRITHTFGWTPLQQYLVDFGSGKRQALNVAWDTERERWFALNPEEDIRHGDWLHWTGGSMNWNTMCADCHSTNLHQNYDAEADSFHTTWSSINVSCEACHGPGQAHVAFMEGEGAEQATIERIRQDLKLTAGSGQQDQISQCASCHALREKLQPNYRHSGEFMDYYSPSLPHPESYFADGQIKGEVYVWGSFLQSKMYKKGIRCTDCHDPHSLKLKANVTDNSLCMQCHQPSYDRPEHHFHPADTEASQCISRHMPGRYYMEVDFRRDHSFRVPRPDLSVQYGTPNACQNCHSDRSDSWAADAVNSWYGPERARHPSEIWLRADSLGEEVFPELAAMVTDTSFNPIARATGLWYLGQIRNEESAEVIGQALASASPLVRNSAARTLANFPISLKSIRLQDALDDSVRAVRLAAAQGLAELTTADIEFSLKKAFESALEEYRNYLGLNRYFPQGQMNRGQFFEQRNETEQAVDAYLKALEKDSLFHPARLNLAYLYNRMGQNSLAEEQLRRVIRSLPDNGPAHYSLALLLAEENRMEETLDLFEKAARLMPDHARVRYNWAIALQRLDRPGQAEEAYRKALDLEPDNPQYLYGFCTLLVQQEQFERAEPYVRRLVELQPDNQTYRRLLELTQNR